MSSRMKTALECACTVKKLFMEGDNVHLYDKLELIGHGRHGLRFRYSGSNTHAREAAFLVYGRCPRMSVGKIGLTAWHCPVP